MFFTSADLVVAALFAALLLLLLVSSFSTFGYQCYHYCKNTVTLLALKPGVVSGIAADKNLIAKKESGPVTKESSESSQTLDDADVDTKGEKRCALSSASLSLSSSAVSFCLSLVSEEGSFAECEL
ncbi:unnamed protein product [Soboliphyme baturini]|uniref:Secreted protein n=1 Tax=Soboliphyme baturini TaxID=241478 RepID=A0A183IC64_9BILA|nr:unnamed protein product [Soboliphyme baturini]